jgi:diguanylate cyclase (GGDEF)-like protein
MQLELKNLSLSDDLTGLHNRRGFLNLAEQQIKISHRSNTGFLLLFMDINGLKSINDQFGHNTGDSALSEFAKILKSSFRDSDIKSRLGGDEFAVIAINAYKGNAEHMIRRLEMNIKKYNTETDSPFKLSASIGSAYYDPAQPISLPDLIDQADSDMYVMKQEKISRYQRNELRSSS